MLEHTRKHPINYNAKHKSVLYMSESGQTLKLPMKVAEALAQYVIENRPSYKSLFMNLMDKSSEDPFADINKKYTKTGALIRGLRIREDMSQKEFAKSLHITQGDLSKMENGKRPVGKTIAKRIAEKFHLDYRLFL